MADVADNLNASSMRHPSEKQVSHEDEKAGSKMDWTQVSGQGGRGIHEEHIALDFLFLVCFG